MRHFQITILFSFEFQTAQQRGYKSQSHYEVENTQHEIHTMKFLSKFPGIEFEFLLKILANMSSHYMSVFFFFFVL